ncbi:MAG TPA: HAD domain-containing protein [Solirubrobacteraceae bacterium]|nr:HAD domain-containing protein [Solirubrobacteraceae bacterium]
MRPLLMVDVDGVISLFGVPRQGDRQAPPRGSLHSVDGMVHFLSATAAAHLLELSQMYELVWASGWEERAEEHLPRLLGLPAGLPYLSFDREPGASGAHWKLEAIERFARRRALAWVDDCFNEACHRWAAGRESPTLLVATDPRHGLTARETDRLRGWAAALEGLRPGQDVPARAGAQPAGAGATGTGGAGGRAATASETAAP